VNLTPLSDDLREFLGESPTLTRHMLTFARAILRDAKKIGKEVKELSTKSDLVELRKIVESIEAIRISQKRSALNKKLGKARK